MENYFPLHAFVLFVERKRLIFMLQEGLQTYEIN